jgi:hypothetical protein
MNKSTNTMTDYITLTEMWQDGDYRQVGYLINKEEWGSTRVAEFCVYMAKHLGLEQLNVLSKII